MNRTHPGIALLTFAVAAWLGGLGSTGKAGPATEFRRGIGIGAMAWAAVEPGPAKSFVFPPFAGPSYALRFDEVQTLRRTGFDFVRLAVDPGPFLQFKSSRRDALDRILMERVQLILSAGLAVIVDFHPSDMQPDYTARALTQGIETPVFRDYLRLVERTARLLGRLHSRRTALELLNEPPIPPDRWQPMLEAAYAAARRGSADLLLVLEGGNEASAAALMGMRTAPFAADREVLYSFHYYDPYQFTHQGAPWNAARYLADVPYPARARPLSDSLEASAAVIAATRLPRAEQLLADLDAQQRLRSYWNSGFDGSAIAQAFDRIDDWARARDLPPDRILLGEFGARETMPQRDGGRAAERAQWFRDASRQAAIHGFGWAVWAYRGNGGFALARSENSDDIEPNVAKALGLTPPPHAADLRDGVDALRANP
jgi:endoglucanase